MGFSRQEYWSGLLFPSAGDLPDPGIELRSPALEADALTSEPLALVQQILYLVSTYYEPGKPPSPSPTASLIAQLVKNLPAMRETAV